MTAAYDTTWDWQNQAACRNQPADAFFPRERSDGGSDQVRHAKAICRTCPVRRRCLQLALDYENDQPRVYRHGIWGGLTPRERARLDGKATD